MGQFWKPRRRDAIRGMAGLAASTLSGQPPALVTPDRLRPAIPCGVQAGDVVAGRAMVWARTDRPARMVVTYGTSERSREEHRIAGPMCTAETDFTGRVELTGLPADQTLVYAVRFEDAGSPRATSEPVTGQFRSAPGGRRNVRLLWSGDLVGQGWGINPRIGGMKIYETMRRREPDLFLQSGDNIYADNPVQAEVKLADGTLWHNLVTEEKSKVAETLQEFRGAYRYNFLDENLRRFNASVAQIWQWDDHEVLNNWSPGKDLSDNDLYKEKDIRKLAARAAQAFQEYAPLRPVSQERNRVYRRIPYGPLLDVFVLDMRTYRGPNTYNLQEREGPDTAYLGQAQRTWLKNELRRSTAVWKVIASDMPLGLVVGDGKDAQGRARFENSANTDGAPLGRELEIADLLQDMKRHRVRNAVWLTADVHYTAAHYYDPRKAQFTEFDPFWEFVSGPLNAGTFGPSATDNTFGIQVVFQKVPEGKGNLPPSAGMQFFGEVDVDGKTAELAVTLRDLKGAALFTKQFAPER